MRLLKELPEIEEKIDSGKLSLSVISQAQQFFRQERKADHPLGIEEKRNLLKVLEGRSSREAERELISRASQPMQMRPESVRTLDETHSEVKFVANAGLLQDLEKIRGLLGHRHGDLSMAELVALLAKIALEKLDPAREPKRLVSASEVNRDSVDPHRIPAALRRTTWKRDRGRCTQCNGIFRLQIDHIKPVALGGPTSIENLRLLCFHCNQLHADRVFGRPKMEGFRKTV
jgi:hypothetical protein